MGIDMKVTHTGKTVDFTHYAPLAVGNGSLSLLVDEYGSARDRKFCANKFKGGIWIAGVRYDKLLFPLVPFGEFRDSCVENDTLTEWSQTFDITGACVENICSYSSGNKLLTRVWTPTGHDLIIIEKEILEEGTSPVAEIYSFAPPRTVLDFIDEKTTAFEIDTFTPVTGEISFFTVEGEAEFTRNKETVSGVMKSRRVVFVLAFDVKAKEYALSHTFESLKKEHEADWQSFWDESTVPRDLPERLELAARTSEYHLRISSTNWSIPTGIYPTHWDGKYFGFDVYFAVMGLLRSGHTQVAAKVPRHYFNLLDTALRRNYRYFGVSGSAARYYWVGLELPVQAEGTGGGFWLEHVFHMTHIGLVAEACAAALNDPEYTRNIAYPVMRGCAEFFRLHQVYDLDGRRYIIGKCTDLERLGAGRENPFMTSCGAIALFRKTADMAEKLGCDAELAAEWRKMADGLLLTLPHNGENYLPYPGCPDPSIALFSGLYPYEVLDPSDTRLQKGIDWFCRNERKFGNMYPTGNALCIWYAGWKALTLLRQGKKDEAKAIVNYMAESTGQFGEVFEIYETCDHPWFTTAEGIYLQSLCECFAEEK